MSRILAYAATAIIVAYPFAVYFGLSKWGISALAPVLLVLFAIRLFQKRPPIRSVFVAGIMLSAIGITLAILAWVFKKADWLLYYPVAANLLFLSVFAGSLAKPPTVIERLARITQPDLPEKGVRYTRTVTQVWCVFFVLNGSIALATCLAGNLNLWTLYNGCISYILMGLLFGGEWLIRQKVMVAR